MADTQQGVRHQSARDAAGTTDTYDGDLRALFNAVATVPAGSTYNEAFMLWLQSVTGSSADNINDLAALYASQQEDTYNWSSVGGLGLPTLFDWEPETAETLPVTSTFTRASVGEVLTTTDGTTNWYQEAKSGELRLDGLRRVENLLDSATGTGPFTAITKNGRLAVSVIADTGTLTITIGGTPQVFTPTGTPQRFVAFDDATGGSTTVAISGTATLSQPMAHLCQVGSDVPEPYVQHDAEFLNIGVNGVTYFNTANTSTVDGSGVVTEATGATITGGGYLPEPAATNIITDSNDLTDAAWTADGASPTDDGINALGLNQSTIDAGVGAGRHIIFISLTYASMDYSASVIAKQGAGAGGRYLVIGPTNNTTDFACFDLQTGAITEEANIVDATIEDLGNGFYRCSVIDTQVAGSKLYVIAMSDTGTPGTRDPTFSGANDTMLISHVQSELSFTASPIITSGSTVTRVADDLTDATWPAEHSALCDVTMPEVFGGTIQPTLLGYSSSSSHRFYCGGSSANNLILSGGGGMIAAFVAGSDYLGERHKFAFSGKDAEAIIVDDESNSDTDTTGTIGTGTINIGQQTGGGQKLRGRMHNITIYSATQTQSELEALTS